MPSAVLWLLSLWGLSCSPEPPPGDARTVSKPPISDTQNQPVWTDQVIDWRSWSDLWSPEKRPHRPILIYLAARGCDGLFAEEDGALRSLVEERYLGIRVNPFHRPDLARRYGQAGWPALAILTPEGRLVTSATDIPPKNVRLLLLRMLDHLNERPEVIDAKIRVAKIRSAKTRAGGSADEITSAASAEDLFAAIAADFDDQYAGFGDGVKFPEPLVLRFLLEFAERPGGSDRGRGEQAWSMVRRTLDVLTGSPTWDEGAGGIFVYSLTRDWLTPEFEKDGADQAALLSLLVRAAQGNPGHGYRERVRQLLEYIGEQLFDEQRGVYLSRQVRLSADRWWTDPAVYADRNGLLITASLEAAALLDDEQAALQALSAARFLMKHSISEDGTVFHCLHKGVKLAPGLLADQAIVALALLAAHEWSGEPEFSRSAHRARRWMEKHLLDPATGTFFDGPTPEVAAWLQWPRLTPYEDGLGAAGNTLAAELYLRLGEAGRTADLLEGAPLGRFPARSYASYGSIALRYESRLQ